MLKSLNNLHHANLVIGDPLEAERSLIDFFAGEGEALVGSPDFFLLREKTFGIDEARSLANSAIRKAFGKRKVFLIAPEKITFEAQNALLKTFEEPIAETYFFLCLRDEGLVLPTLLSRMQVVRMNGAHKVSAEVQKFLGMGVKDRLTFAKKFVEAEKDLSVFLDDLLVILRDSGKSEWVEKVYKARLVSSDRGASPRLILEHLSLVL